MEDRRSEGWLWAIFIFLVYVLGFLVFNQIHPIIRFDGMIIVYFLGAVASIIGYIETLLFVRANARKKGYPERVGWLFGLLNIIGGIILVYLPDLSKPGEQPSEEPQPPTEPPPPPYAPPITAMETTPADAQTPNK